MQRALPRPSPSPGGDRAGPGGCPGITAAEALPARADELSAPARRAASARRRLCPAVPNPGRESCTRPATAKPPEPGPGRPSRRDPPDLRAQYAQIAARAAAAGQLLRPVPVLEIAAHPSHGSRALVKLVAGTEGPRVRLSRELLAIAPTVRAFIAHELGHHSGDPPRRHRAQVLTAAGVQRLRRREGALARFVPTILRTHSRPSAQRPAPGRARRGHRDTRAEGLARSRTGQPPSALKSGVTAPPVGRALPSRAEDPRTAPRAPDGRFLIHSRDSPERGQVGNWGSRRVVVLLGASASDPGWGVPAQGDRRPHASSGVEQPLAR